jgi:hypothetical protein
MDLQQEQFLLGVKLLLLLSKLDCFKEIEFFTVNKRSNLQNFQKNRLIYFKKVKFFIQGI